jgi:hypothetical protein
VKNVKTRVAAAATILGLGGLAGIALNAGGRASAPVGVKPLVRTKVIHQTVHVTKHIKPKHPAAGGTPGSPYRITSTTSEPIGGVTTAASSNGSPPAASSPAPVTTSSSGAAAAPNPGPSHESAPVVTHTSGSHSGSAGSGGSGGGTSAPVVTHTSGGGASAGSGQSPGNPVVTHTSGAGGGGGGEHEGGDKGD